MENKPGPAALRTKLLYEMKEGIYRNEKRLPPEAMLAETLGVSRTLIRDVLGTLEREGYISRRQGIGTIINRHVFDVPLRMDFEIEFADRVRAMGYEPETILTDVSTVLSDKRMAEKLGVALSSPVFRVCKLVKASGRSAIYCMDHISFQTICDYGYQRQELEAPIFEFLRRYCNTDVHLDLTEVNAVVADEALASIMEIPVGAPLLNMDELFYNIEGQPIMWSLEYYTPNVMKYTVLRKRPSQFDL